jgi:calcium/calmodulin-dependent protein kinase (CaM kinase) II
MNHYTGAKKALADELLAMNQRLLESILVGDWETYSTLCDPTITAFEPESRGTLVEGLDFHGFYFDQGGVAGPHNTTIAAPHVRLLGDDAAVVCYVRLTQRMDEHNKPVTNRCEETRVWQRQGGAWKHVHFHRATCP